MGFRCVRKRQLSVIAMIASFDKSSGQILLNEESEDNQYCVVQQVLRFAQNDSVVLFHPKFLRGYVTHFYNLAVRT
jgi:hypothetical protein